MARLRMRPANEIRWYLYRSATKIEMLFQQLVASQGPFAGALSLEFAGAKASMNTSPMGELHDDEKLELIERELRKRGLVGTLADPGQYFAGEIQMRWGLFNDNGDRPADGSPLVFFGGVDFKQNLMVGLGGSSRNVVGHYGASSTYSRSNSRAITDWMLSGLADTPVQARWDPEGERQLVLGGVGIAIHYLRPPTQRMRFLAKTLLTGRMPGHEHMTGMGSPFTILGTPLFVTTVNAPRDEDRMGLDPEWNRDS
jgi:hypothetical protein